MDPYAYIGQSIADGFYKGQERRDKKKQLSDEQQYRLAAMKYQNELEQNSLTPEQKNVKGFGFDLSPSGFQQFRQAMDPMGQQEFGLKQAALGVQQQNANSEGAYRNWQMTDGARGMQPTPQMMNIQYLIKMGLPQEKAYQMVFRPDLIQQMMAGMNQNQGGMQGMPGAQPPQWMGGAPR